MSDQSKTPKTDEAKRLLERLRWDVKKLPFCRILASLEQSEIESSARAERIAELEEISGGFEAEMAKFEHLANESLALCEKAQAENAKLREALGELDKLKPDFTSPEVYYWAVKDIISQALTRKDGEP